MVAGSEKSREAPSSSWMAQERCDTHMDLGSRSWKQTVGLESERTNAKEGEMGCAPRDGAQLAGPERRDGGAPITSPQLSTLRQMSTLDLLLQGALKHAVGSSDGAWVGFLPKGDGVLSSDMQATSGPGSRPE